MINVRMATPADEHLPAYDYTRLTAINTCPRKGILQYTLHKTMYHGGRAMALEQGKVLHDCFAAIRLFQLGDTQKLPHLMHHHGKRLFGADRWEQLSIAFRLGDDPVVQSRNLSWEVLATSNWVDDPEDKRRTYANMEAAIAYYCSRWDFTRYPVWVRDVNDAVSDVGVEIPFNVVVDIDGHVAKDGFIASAWTSPKTFRLIGRVDGIHTDRDGNAIIHENKSAFRLDRTWRDHFRMSHQPTGYCIAASAFSGMPVSDGVIVGLQTPLPKSVIDGVMFQPFTRAPYMFDQWARWVVHTIDLHDSYDVMTAPTYTHSCRAYQRSCEFLPFCESAPEDQEMMLGHMHERHWSPLKEGGDDD